MYKVIILGSGASPGVPSVSNGWGSCNPDNPKNCRTRTSTYLQYGNTKILIDTSPDIRSQLLQSGIRHLDAVLYTHTHADHLHGIDDLREINRIEGKSLDFYADAETVKVIKNRFPYLIGADGDTTHPSLIPHTIEYYRPFIIKDLKITPIRLAGHTISTTGYIFNDGEVVYIADYRHLEEETFRHILQPVKLLVLPLTIYEGTNKHAGLADILTDIGRINPERAVINHMASEIDYDDLMRRTPQRVEPGYDNMLIEVK